MFGNILFVAGDLIFILLFIGIFFLVTSLVFLFIDVYRARRDGRSVEKLYFILLAVSIFLILIPLMVIVSLSFKYAFRGM